MDDVLDEIFRFITNASSSLPPSLRCVEIILGNKISDDQLRLRPFNENVDTRIIDGLQQQHFTKQHFTKYVYVHNDIELHINKLNDGSVHHQGCVHRNTIMVKSQMCKDFVDSKDVRVIIKEIQPVSLNSLPSRTKYSYETIEEITLYSDPIQSDVKVQVSSAGGGVKIMFDAKNTKRAIELMRGILK